MLAFFCYNSCDSSNLEVQTNFIFFYKYFKLLIIITYNLKKIKYIIIINNSVEQNRNWSHQYYNREIILFLIRVLIRM